MLQMESRGLQQPVNTSPGSTIKKTGVILKNYHQNGYNLRLPVYTTTTANSSLNVDAPVFVPSTGAKIATIAEHRKGPTLTGSVENVKVEFLVDTGAESTVLSKRCFETLPGNVRSKFLDSISSVYVADGTRV